LLKPKPKFTFRRMKMLVCSLGVAPSNTQRCISTTAPFKSTLQPIMLKSPSTVYIAELLWHSPLLTR